MTKIIISRLYPSERLKGKRNEMQHPFIEKRGERKNLAIKAVFRTTLLVLIIGMAMITVDSSLTHAKPPPHYKATINAHCHTEGVDVSVNITMDGSYTGYGTPHTFTALSGSHSFTVPWYDVNGHPFLQWSTGETSPTITVASAGTYTAYYVARTKVDVVRIQTVISPSAQLNAMQTGITHFWPDLIRTSDIETLGLDGFTMLSTPGYHMGHIGFNIRTDQSYRTDRPAAELPYVAAVLSDVNFRHAVLCDYDQDGILASIYKYIVTKSTSLVPPAQGNWLSPNVPQHPYNPGDPFATTVYNPTTKANEDSCSILRYGGYTFVDADGSHSVTAVDYWTKAGWGNAPLPTLNLLTPTNETAPTSAEHGARIINGLKAIGLNNMHHEPYEFSSYIEKVYQDAEFDMFMIFWDLGRFPDHLYDMCHSSQDCHIVPWAYNAPGINDPQIDLWAETVKFGLNRAQMLQAAWALQDALYNPDNSYAFAYMQLYSRMYFDASNPMLGGIVNSPGFGADNMWTWLNWVSTTTPIVYTNGEYPERLNPLYASTVYAWNVMNPLLDGLIAVDPYTHEDVPWLATSWTITQTGPTSMDITFNLRAGVEWQDGNPYTAEDARFNWLFLRDNRIPRYLTAWQHITGVDVITPGAGGTVRVHLNETSQFLLYDLAGTAAILPPPVWSWLNGKPTTTILGYDPSTNTTKPTGAGSRFGTADGPKNQLYATGPYIFQSYDQVNGVADVWTNLHYFLETATIHLMLTTMFHRVGDVNSDGKIDDTDLTRMTLSYGYYSDEPEYDPEADVNSDGVVDGRDVALLSSYWAQQREYP
jgi:ABC-type transport system substrate-binding protein